MPKSPSTRAPAPAKPRKPRFKPALTQKQVESIESKYNETWGVNRRITLASLTRSSQQLLDYFSNPTKEDEETLIAMMESVSEYIDHLKNGISLAEIALARMLLIGEYVSNEAGEVQT